MTAILSKRSPKGEVQIERMKVKPEIMMNEEGEVDPKHLAAQDILGAHHEKSPERLMEALSNFINLHLHSESGNKPEIED